MDAVDDLKWFIFIIIALWVVWFFTGGPESERARGGLFLRPPAPLDTGETYGELEISNRETGTGTDTNEDTISIFRDKVSISGISGALLNDPNMEYIEIKAELSNKNPLYISGWSIKNSNGNKLTIGNGDKLPIVGEINTESALFLNPGEKVVITTGRSPIGVSFKVNTCSGYLEQFQDFTPPLKQMCPQPEHIAASLSGNIESECSNFISAIPRCSIYTGETPSGLSQTCSSMIYNKINYNGCVGAYKNKSDFYSPEWRVFLGANSEFWSNNGDLIRLYDNSGNLVNSRSY